MLKQGRLGGDIVIQVVNQQEPLVEGIAVVCVGEQIEAVLQPYCAEGG